MYFTSSKRRLILFIAVCFCSFLITGCNKYKDNSSQNTQDNQNTQNTIEVETWFSQKNYLRGNFWFPNAEYSLPENFFPWTGTVSHHQLTDKLIDDWFYQIQIRRNVENFIIICPSHYGLSTQPYSVADCVWNCGEYGNVEINRELSQKICQNLDVTYDNNVFYEEHGASCLMPYLKKYFPKAKVAVVAINGEPPIDMNYTEKLKNSVEEFFTPSLKKKNFLIISSDFAHHGTEEEVLTKDKNSRIFFENPTPQNFLACRCDNRPGIYVMASLLSKDSTAHILYNTNSYYISGFDADDITTYFFSLFN